MDFFLRRIYHDFRGSQTAAGYPRQSGDFSQIFAEGWFVALRAARNPGITRRADFVR
jgi:hypothetical protein